MSAPQILGTVGELGEERWLTLRRGSIGASDVPAILGVSPFHGPMNVYASKVAGDSLEDNDYLRWGKMLEPLLLNWLRGEAGIAIPLSQIMVQSGDTPFMTCTLDGGERPEGGGLIPVEVKNTAWKESDWGDGVPDYVNAQIQAQIHVCQAPYAYVVATIGGQPPVWARVDRDQPFLDEVLVPAVTEFWEQHIQAEVPPDPDGNTWTTRAIKAIYPGGGEELTALGSEFLELDVELREKEEGLKILKEATEEIKNRFKMAIGNAPGGVLSDGTKFWWKPDKNGHRRWRRVEGFTT